MGKLTQSRKRPPRAWRSAAEAATVVASMSGISIFMRRATPPPGEASEGDHPTR
jgi:hypothetical protein